MSYKNNKTQALAATELWHVTAPQSVGSGVTALGVTIRSYSSLPKRLFILTDSPLSFYSFRIPLITHSFSVITSNWKAVHEPLEDPAHEPSSPLIMTWSVAGTCVFLPAFYCVS